MGLTDQVLICTHSDFCRTITSNTTAGTDHAWGNHQLIMGGGAMAGRRMIGAMPDLELGGSSDITGFGGSWIPTLSVTQMTAAIGASSWALTDFPLSGIRCSRTSRISRPATITLLAPFLLGAFSIRAPS